MFAPCSLEPCFAEGTLIATARGQVAVENLCVGDLVVVRQGRPPLQPITGIGRQRIDLSCHAGREATAPIRIRAGALAPGMPLRDLRLSPDQPVQIDAWLIPARLLVNGQSIVQELWCPEITYWHIALRHSGLVIAEGALAEAPAAKAERQRAIASSDERPYSNSAATTSQPDVRPAALTAGPPLERIRARLLRRAKLLTARQQSFA